MANLGTPSHTQVNQGEQRINREGDVAATGAALNIIGKGIEYAVDRAAATKTEEGIDTALTEVKAKTSQAATAALTAEDLEGYDFTPAQEAEIIQISTQIEQAKAMASQATRQEVRDLALLRVQQQTQKLRRFGFSAERVDAMTARVMSSSPELQEALMNASGSDAAIAASSDYIDRIAKQGYDELGIDAKYPVGSPEFLRHYAERQTWKQERERDQQYYNMKVAAGSVTDGDRLNETRSALLKSNNFIDTEISNQIIAELGALDNLRADPSTTPMQIVEEYEKFIPFANSMARRIDKTKTEVERGFSKIWANSDERDATYNLDGPEYRNARAIVDRTIEDLDRKLQMLEQGKLEIVDYLRQEQVIKGHGLLERMPTFSNIAAINSVAPELFQTMDSLDYVNQIPLLSTEVLQHLGREFNVSGILVEDVAQSERIDNPESRAAEREARDARSPYNGGLTISQDPDIDTAEVFVPLSVILHTGATTPSAIAPDQAFDFHLTGIAAGMQRVHRMVRSHPEPNLDVNEQLNEVSSYLTGDTFWNRMKTFDRSTPAARDFKYQLETSFLRSAAATEGGALGLMPHSQMRNDILTRATKERYGRPFSEFFEVDIDKAENEDVFIFKLDEKAAEAAIRADEERVRSSLRRFDAGDRLPAARPADIEYTVQTRLAQMKLDAQRLAKDATTYGRLLSLAETPDGAPLKLSNVFLLDRGGETSFVEMFAGS